MVFDDYIFDSQFSFLNESLKLKNAYITLIKNSAHKEESLPLIAYFKEEKWDTETFKRRTGRLLWLENKVNTREKYKAVIDACQTYNCCYLRFNRAHSFCEYAKKNKLPLLSEKASQYLDLAKSETIYDHSLTYWKYEKEEANPGIIDQVLSLASHTFMYNRFLSDSHFSAEQVKYIYSNWIINEITLGTSELYTLQDGNRVSSFFLYKEDISPVSGIKIGFVSLIASTPDQKNKNAATNLLNFVIDNAKLNGTNYVIANTEIGSTGAIQFFKKNKFIQNSFLNEYHVWN